jgi:hypothetical protein
VSAVSIAGVGGSLGALGGLAVHMGVAVTAGFVEAVRGD